jgi:hypothetical protein
LPGEEAAIESVDAERHQFPVQALIQIERVSPELKADGFLAMLGR